MPTAVQAVAAKAQEVEVGSLRHRALVTVQQFKSSWVELGALLVEVRRAGSFAEWGFKSFEEYCSKELRLKRQTADKLTASYAFLARHERQAVESRLARETPPADSRPIPPFEVISVLAGAEERGQLAEDDWRELRDSLWSDEGSSPAKLSRQLAQRFPPPPREEPPVDLRLRRFAATARKLQRELEACADVPEAITERAGALAEDLESLSARGV